MAREWFTAAELAEMALPNLPSTGRGIALLARREEWDHPANEGRTWRRHEGRGGGVEYNICTLPQRAQTALLVKQTKAREVEIPAQKARVTSADLWSWFDRQTAKKKAEAKRRLDVLLAVEAAERNGMRKVTAVQLVCSELGIAPSGYYRWEALVREHERGDWLPALAPRHAGSSGQEAECSPAAWDWLRAAYLRPEQPNFADCYRQLLLVAAEQDPPWRVPSERTLFRRMQALPETTRVFLRKGADALKRMLPAQQRDHAVFRALQAVNTDDHRMDVFVRWQDGTVARPHLLAVQDIYSGMILGWRVDRSENTQAIRLAIGDVVEEFGIPELFWFDNTRAAANKDITGGQPNRYRFKVRDEDPPGLVEMLGAEVRFAQPFHGQAKPVERAFRDAAQDWAKDIRFAGAYTGNNPTAKPANYGSKAVPIATLVAVIAERIEEHNTRIGRRSPVAAGRSFRETFDESYRGAREQGLIRQATQAQRQLFLLQAEPATIRREQPMLHLFGNRYFAPFMLQMAGQKVVARFDADALHDDIHVYALDGRYLGPAECQHPAGFADTAAAREHARKTKALFRAHRDLAELERTMTLEQAAALLPRVEKAEAAKPETKVVRPLFGTVGSAALKPAPAELEDDLPEDVRDQVRANLAFFPGPKRPADE
jgi:putative transposase